MPGNCTVCRHPDRKAVDHALLQGETFRYIAQRYGLSTTALVRHRDDHLPAALRRARDADDLAHALDLVAQLKAVNSAAFTVLQQARQAGDGGLALRAIDRVVRQLELVARAGGQIDDRPQVSVFLSAEWGQIHAVLLRVLEDHLEARIAVAEALVALEETGQSAQFRAQGDGRSN